MEEKEVGDIIVDHPSGWIDYCRCFNRFLAHGDAGEVV